MLPSAADPPREPRRLLRVGDERCGLGQASGVADLRPVAFVEPWPLLMATSAPALLAPGLLYADDRRWPVLRAQTQGDTGHRGGPGG
jgi:hypothetical protein